MFMKSMRKDHGVCVEAQSVSAKKMIMTTDLMRVGDYKIDQVNPQQNKLLVLRFC